MKMVCTRYIEVYEENEKLKSDWEHILSFQPKRVFYSHRPERVKVLKKKLRNTLEKPTKRDDKELSEEIRDMVLPKELKEFVGTQELIDRSGHSPAKVFETGRGYFIKCDEPGELAREHQMTKVFHQLGFGPEAIKLITLDRDYLVTRKVHGEDLTENLQNPLQLCRLLADALRFLHSQPVPLQPNNEIPISSRYTRYMESAAGDISGGYYDPSVCLDRYGTFSKEEAWDVMQQSKDLLRCDTLIHGDACLPNIIQQNGAFLSFIDLSMSGIGDRHIDLYWALWSLRYNLKTEAYSETFLDYYGRDNFSEEMFRVIAAFEVFG